MRSPAAAHIRRLLLAKQPAWGEVAVERGWTWHVGPHGAGQPLWLQRTGEGGIEVVSLEREGALLLRWLEQADWLDGPWDSWDEVVEDDLIAQRLCDFVSAFGHSLEVDPQAEPLSFLWETFWSLLELRTALCAYQAWADDDLQRATGLVTTVEENTGLPATLRVDATWRYGGRGQRARSITTERQRALSLLRTWFALRVQIHLAPNEPRGFGLHDLEPYVCTLQEALWAALAAGSGAIDLPGPVVKVCEAPRCPTPYFVGERRRKYCSDRCRYRAQKRKQRGK